MADPDGLHITKDHATRVQGTRWALRPDAVPKLQAHAQAGRAHWCQPRWVRGAYGGARRNPAGLEGSSAAWPRSV